MLMQNISLISYKTEGASSLTFRYRLQLAPVDSEELFLLFRTSNEANTLS